MLLFLVLAFSLPVAIGLYLYSGHRFAGGQGHGELIQPPRSLGPATALEWRGKWHLVYVSGAACDASCRNALRVMRQLHVSLAKDIDRLQRAWVIDGVAPDGAIAALRQQYPDLQVLNGGSEFARHFDAGMTGPAVGRLYLVDPLGNLMMRYPPDVDPYGIRKDLMRLLTYSWTG